MEYPFSSKEKGISYWGSPRTQIDGITSLDGVTRYSGLEDPFNNVADLMNFDTYAGWCSSPSMADQMSGSYSFAPLDLVSTNCPPLDQLNFSEQSCGSFGVADGDVVRSSVSKGEKMAFQQIDPQFGFLLNPVDGEGSGAKRSSTSCQQNNIMDVGNWTIPRPLERPLAEKMLSALSLFQESSGGGILAQIWVPVKDGDHYRLSTSEQPYLLDQMLVGYREISRRFTFSVEAEPGSSHGLPGRVFASKIPEWTSNVIYYNKDEYLRVQHAVNHEVRGSIALPIFSGDPLETSCCAVLELATLKEKASFDSEMEHVCRAFQVSYPFICLDNL